MRLINILLGTFICVLIVPSEATAMLQVNAVSVIASRTAATGAIANSETQILGVTIPSGSITATGNTYRIMAVGILTGTATSTSTVWRIRYGTTTLTGNIPASVTLTTGTTARSNIPFLVTALVNITATGGSGTCFGGIFVNLYNVVAPVASAAVTGTVALDTTADKILELTFISGGVTTTATFIAATIESMGS